MTKVFLVCGQQWFKKFNYAVLCFQGSIYSFNWTWLQQPDLIMFIHFCVFCLSPRCKVCPLTFLTKSEMQIHSKSHTEAKPHKCPHCSKTFANASYLSQHLRIHLGIKPYHCSYCENSFRQLSHLQQHTRSVQLWTQSRERLVSAGKLKSHRAATANSLWHTCTTEIWHLMVKMVMVMIFLQHFESFFSCRELSAFTPLQFWHIIWRILIK